MKEVSALKNFCGINLSDSDSAVRPLSTPKLIGWLMRRFRDLASRNEAARFLNLMTKQGFFESMFLCLIHWSLSL